MSFARGVGIVFGVRSVGNDEYLHILIQPAGRPEAVALIALYLVEGLAYGHAAPLEFHMNHGKAVHQNGDIVAGFVISAILLILVDDLKAVVVDVLLVDEGDVLGAAVVAREVQDAVFLHAPGLFLNAVLPVRKLLMEKARPLLIGKTEVVQKFELPAQVPDQRFFLMHGKILVPLRAELPDEFFFQRRFALVGVGTHGRRRVFGHHRAFRALGHHVEAGHFASLKVRSLSR